MFIDIPYGTFQKFHFDEKLKLSKVCETRRTFRIFFYTWKFLSDFFNCELVTTRNASKGNPDVKTRYTEIYEIPEAKCSFTFLSFHTYLAGETNLYF